MRIMHSGETILYNKYKLYSCMKKLVQTTLLLCVSLLALSQYTVGDKTITYTDAARSNRSVGVQFRFPGTNTAVASGQFPFVVFAHGFSMDQSPYYPYADSLAKRGYIVGLLTTETGLSPSHTNFAQDILFVYDKLIAENSNNASFFFQHVVAKGAIGGHSMGGGSTVLSAQFGNPEVCCFTFAAATTNPSSISAAHLMTKPYLSFGGSSDCIAPVNTNQQPMYDSSGSSCKFLINITNGLHCQYGNANSACSLGEGFSGCASSPLTRQQQIDKTLLFLIPYLDYYLKGDCNAWTTFESRYTGNTVDVKQRNCTNSIPANPSISGNNFFCAGNSTTLTANPSGFQYLWNDNSTANTLNTNAPGIYSVVVGNGTCSLPAISVSVTQNLPPAVPSAIVSVDSVCSGSPNVAISVANDPLATTYNWNLPAGWNITSGANTNSIQVNAGSNGGTVSVTAENSCGPSSASSKQIAVLATALGNPGTIISADTVCSGIANVSLSVAADPGATSYNWTLPGGWNITNGVNTNNIQVTSGTSSGIVSVTAQNICATSSSSSKLLTVVPSNLGVPGTITGNDTLCAGQQAQFSISAVAGAASYLWNIPAGWNITSSPDSSFVETIASSAGGNITVSAVNQCGQSVPSSFTVAVLSAPSLTGEIIGIDTFCTGSNLGANYSLSAIPAGDNIFHWSAPLDWQFVTDSNSASPVVNVSSTGTLAVYVSNVCGNSNSLSLDAYVVDTPIAQINISSNTLVAAPNGVGYSYRWYLNSQLISGAIDSFYVPLQSGNYSVLVTNPYGCSGVSPETVFVYNDITVILREDFTIYPNPNTGSDVVIEGNLVAGSVVKIYSAIGQLVKEAKLNNAKNIIAVRGFSSGIYLVTVDALGVTKRLVIE